MFGSERHRLRKRLRDQGFAAPWRAVLAERMAHWTLLDDDERHLLEERALALMIDKRWEAAQGFELDDEVMVTIAAQAALLTLGLGADAYRNVGSIIVHPTTIERAETRTVVPGLVTDEVLPILGEAHYDGPVLIVWDAVLADARHPRSGHNVVYHEFAHKLDMLDGVIDGTPPLDGPDAVAEWVAVCTDAYERVQRGEAAPILSSYGGVNPGEFFAVATEAFFDGPRALQHDEPELYGVLAGFYRQDPAGRAARRG